MAIWTLVVIVYCAFVGVWAAPTGENSENYLRLPALQEEEYHEISPELLDIYKDFELLNKLEKGNITNDRGGRGFLTKLYFLTGLKLGSILTSSGTLAASNSIQILGKVLNSAISVSYGSVEGLVEPVPEINGGVIQSEIPVVETLATEAEPKTQSSNTELKTESTTKSFAELRKSFLSNHNELVADLNKSIAGKSRTPRFS